jgi:hypothetical protein
MIFKWIKQRRDRKRREAFKKEAKEFSIFSGKAMMMFLLLASVATYFAVTYIELEEHTSTMSIDEKSQDASLFQ